MRALPKNTFIALAFVVAGSACGSSESNVFEAAKEIDALLVNDWRQHKLTPNLPANDETFVRRVHLDIIGRIPTLLEARTFFSEH